MSDLQNQTPADTYKGLLQVGDYTNGVDGNSEYILDGEGTPSALSISTSKVGVGTVSPSAELDVNGGIEATTLTTSGAVTGGSVSTSGAVTAGSLDVSGNVVADEYALDQTGSSSSAVAIHAPTTNELAIRTNTAERVRIDSSGNVGISTTSPSSKLEIISNDNHVNLKVSNTFSQSVLKFSDTDGLAAAINYDHNTDKLHFITDGTFNPSNGALNIDSSGNVGIGTVTPAAPLEVSSTTGGVIMPRMTTTQRTAVSASDGEMVYDTDLHKFYGYANGAWVALH